jgi:N-methylhydantoinase B
LAKKRGRTKLFDFGGSIAELKKRCKRETGLEPPKQPEFQKWVTVETARAETSARSTGRARRRSKAA